MPARVLFRCDASPEIGGGHVMRCLAFADVLAWAGWHPMFAVNPLAEAVVPALAQSRYGVRAINDDVSALALMDEAVHLVVIDHYQLGQDFEQRCRGGDRQIVVFDDLADRVHDCDVLCDPTPRRRSLDYAGKLPAKVRGLLGAGYAIIRPVWRDLRADTLQRHVKGGDVQRIVVSMGATDPANATEKIIQALKLMNFSFQVEVVLGAKAPHIEAVRAALSSHMVLLVDPEDYTQRVAQADCVIGAPGSSSFERAVIGVPSLLIPTADNQRYVAKAFSEMGAAVVLDPALLDMPQALCDALFAFINDPLRRIDVSKAAARLTDGQGVLRLFVASSGELGAVRLRLAEAVDESYLLALQHQPDTRRFARDPSLPSAQCHASWMKQVLADPEKLLMIVEVDGIAAGMVRLDRLHDDPVIFEVSIALDVAKRGQGIGLCVLSLVRRLVTGADVIAMILPQNIASQKMFLKAGYVQVSEETYRSYGV